MATMDRGRIHEKWNKFTDADLAEIEKNEDVLSSKLQKVYGKTLEEADKEVVEFRKGTSGTPAGTPEGGPERSDEKSPSGVRGQNNVSGRGPGNVRP